MPVESLCMGVLRCKALLINMANLWICKGMYAHPISCVRVVMFICVLVGQCPRALVCGELVITLCAFCVIVYGCYILVLIQYNTKS